MRQKQCPSELLCDPMVARSTIGDPVSVITGAVLDTEIDFRLPTAMVPVTWWRSYDSRRIADISGVGRGFRHSFEIELRIDLDGLRYCDASETSIGFPFLTRDGQSAVRHGYRLERLGAQSYRVFNSRGLGFAFEFHRQYPEQACPVALLNRNGHHLPLSFTGGFRAIESLVLDPVYRIDFDHAWDESGPRLLSAILVNTQSATKDPLASYHYDENKCLTTVQDAYRHALRYSYDDKCRLAVKIDRRGYAFYYTYDEQGRCIATRGQDGLEDFSLTYRPLEHQTMVVRADGATRYFVYDAGEQIRQIVAPDGGATVYPVDKAGRVCAAIDPLGNCTTYLFNEQGRIAQQVDPLGHVRSYPADATEHPISHRIASVPMAWDYGQRYGLPHAPLAAEAIDPSWPSQVVAALFFDNDVAGPGRDVHDFQGLLIRQEDRQGRTRRFGYDGNANLRWRQDYDGQLTRFSHSSWNHLDAVVDALGQTLRFRYGPNDRISDVFDAGHTRTHYTYDHCDRIEAITRHQRVRERHSYDLAGNLIEITDAKGQTLVRREIGRANVVVRRHLGSGEHYSYEYDEHGQLVVADGGSGKCTFAYRSIGLRSRDFRDDLGVEHIYFGERLVESRIFGRFVVNYRYLDPATLHITDCARQSTIVRHHSCALVERMDANGTVEFCQYDGHGQVLLRAALSRDDTYQPWIRRFHRSGEGDLLLRQDSQRGELRFAMDGAHRLVGQQNADGSVCEFGYDFAGNLLRAPSLVASYSAGNRLHAANGESFDHDQRDHICTRRSDTAETLYIYDAKDNLVEIRGPGLVYHAQFDGLGRRTHKIVNGETTTFYWDRDRLAAEISPAGALRIYIYADHVALVPLSFVDYDHIDAPPASGRRYVVLTNHLGCPERILDAHEVVVWEAAIAAYGWATIAIGVDFHQPLRWPGHYFDHETGLHDNRFRTYDPRLGRYLQSDPIGLAGGLNLYAYTQNPLREVDLRGHAAHTCPDNVLDCPHRHEGGQDGEAPPHTHSDADPPPPPRQDVDFSDRRAQVQNMTPEEARQYCHDASVELKARMQEAGERSESATTLCVTVLDANGERRVIVTTSDDSQSAPSRVRTDDIGDMTSTPPDLTRERPVYNEDGSRQTQPMVDAEGRPVMDRRATKNPRQRREAVSEQAPEGQPGWQRTPNPEAPGGYDYNTYPKANQTNGYDPPAQSRHHAEQRAQTHAQETGSTVVGMSPTKPCCPGCRRALGEQGLSNIPESLRGED